MFCQLCGQWIGQPFHALFCFRCISDLHRSIAYKYHGSPQHPRLLTLWNYQDEQVQALILKAKAKECWASFRLLLRIVLRDPMIAEWLGPADILIPAPSSLWSRLRGRIDLPLYLSQELAKKYQKDHYHVPGTLWWRWQKRALARGYYDLRLPPDRHTIPAKHPRLSMCIPEGARVVIMDDVITTGHTLREISARLPTKLNVRFLVLARATSEVYEEDHDDGSS